MQETKCQLRTAIDRRGQISTQIGKDLHCGPSKTSPRRSTQLSKLPCVWQSRHHFGTLVDQPGQDMQLCLTLAASVVKLPKLVELNSAASMVDGRLLGYTSAAGTRSIVDPACYEMCNFQLTY